MRTQSKINQVHLEIRQQIVKRVIPPGIKLSEAKLSKHLGVSRTPIREALRRLESEGFVSSKSNHGFIVNSMSIRDVNHIYLIKIALEGLAGRLATPIIARDREKMGTLQNQIQEMEMCCKKVDVIAYDEINFRFHSLIWQWSENPWLIKILSDLSSQLARFIIRALHIPHRIENSLKEHKKILEAIEAGKSKAVEKALATHFKAASEALVKEIYP